MTTLHRLAVFALCCMVAASTIAVAMPAAAPGRYSPEGPRVTVIAPGARLSLRLARLVGEDLALRCMRALPQHGGMLLSVYDQRHPAVFGPRYFYAHVDEIAIDSGGRVVAGMLDMPLRDEVAPPYRRGLLARARYIIDVPAGEAVTDGLIPGQRVRILADPKTLEAERDHSVPPARPCAP